MSELMAPASILPQWVAMSCQGYPMRWIDRLATAQRVVVVIALGLAVGILGGYLTSLGTRTGWYAYAPLSGQVLGPARASVSLAGFG